MTIQYSRNHEKFKALLVEYYPSVDTQMNIFTFNRDTARSISIKKVRVGCWKIKNKLNP